MKENREIVQGNREWILNIKSKNHQWKKMQIQWKGKRGENGNTSLPIQIFNQAAISSVSHLVHASGDDTQIDLEQEMITHDGIT